MTSDSASQPPVLPDEASPAPSRSTPYRLSRVYRLTHGSDSRALSKILKCSLGMFKHT